MKKIYKARKARQMLKKAKVVKQVSSRGKIFSVKFVKKDGSLRYMTCRTGVKKHLKGGINTVKHIPKYLTVYSVQDKGYRNINLKTIKEIKGNNSIFTF